MANEPCSKCGGKGFLNPDGTYHNAFEGSDSDPVVACPYCREVNRFWVNTDGNSDLWLLRGECVIAQIVPEQLTLVETVKCPDLDIPVDA